MKRLMLAAIALAACADETVSGYAASGPWRLAAVDGAPVAARMTLALPSPGRVAGEGPCNAYSGVQAVPYPWFEVRRLAATRRACPDLDTETRWFGMLEAMTLAEASGDVLVLSDGGTHEMEFRLAD